MWLLDYITQKDKRESLAQKGKVSTSSESDVGVVSSNLFQTLKQALPYGVVSVPPEGENAVIVPLKDGKLCLGTVANSRDIEPGELLLFSKGGAEIFLSNDSKVYVNGREI